VTCILLFHDPGNEQCISDLVTYWSTWRVRHFNFQVEVLSQEQKVLCDHMLKVCRTTKARSKKHQTYISQNQPEKSRVAKNSSSTSQCINFRGTSLLDITWGYVDCLVKEAIEIHLNKNNVNKDCGFITSQAWSPITNRLMKVEAGPGRAGIWLCLTTLLSHQQLCRHHDADGLWKKSLPWWQGQRWSLKPSLACSPFNHLKLLAQEYFIEFYTLHFKKVRQVLVQYITANIRCI